LLLAGATRLLFSAGLWVPIFLLSAWSHRFGHLTGRLALGVCVTLVLVSAVVDHRRKQLLRLPQS
jgi:hypothetical protein